MAMQMQRAFNSKFLVTLTRFQETGGSYNDRNDWVVGAKVATTIRGRVVAGNKFSQFEEGMAIHNEDGGKRISDYRSLYITDKYEIDVGDIVGFNGVYYNVLQRSDERHFGFNSYLMETSENWTEDVTQVASGFSSGFSTGFF